MYYHPYMYIKYTYRCIVTKRFKIKYGFWTKYKHRHGIKTSALTGACKFNYPPFQVIMTTNQPTDQPTDRTGGLIGKLKLITDEIMLEMFNCIQLFIV